MGNENITSAVELQRIANELFVASMKSTIQLYIQFRIDHKRLHSPSLNVLFFKDGESLIMDMYSFYPLEKNQEIMKLVKILIEDNSKFEQIKKQYKDSFLN